MNLSDTPNWPEHSAIADDEIFLCCVDGWDVWMNANQWINVNYGPSQNDWFNVQDDPMPDSASAEVACYLRTLASLHQ